MLTSSIVHIKVLLVWPGSLTFPEVLYYVNRYTSITLLLVANYRQYEPRRSTTDV
jgi:hypothetical protein